MQRNAFCCALLQILQFFQRRCERLLPDLLILRGAGEAIHQTRAHLLEAADFGLNEAVLFRQPAQPLLRDGEVTPHDLAFAV